MSPRSTIVRWTVGGRDAEEVLKVTLRRRSSTQHRAGLDEGQVLALCRGKGDRHGRAVCDLLSRGESAMHLRYRVELEESERR